MGDELKPTFDFTKVGRQWSQQMNETIVMATKTQIALNRPAPTGADNAALQAYYDALDHAADYLRCAGDEQAKLVTQVLVDVPREWLLVDAPADLDWSVLASLDWVQEHYYVEILGMIQSGEARKNAKK